MIIQVYRCLQQQDRTGNDKNTIKVLFIMCVKLASGHSGDRGTVEIGEILDIFLILIFSH